MHREWLREIRCVDTVALHTFLRLDDTRVVVHIHNLISLIVAPFAFRWVSNTAQCQPHPLASTSSLPSSSSSPPPSSPKNKTATPSTPAIASLKNMQCVLSLLLTQGKLVAQPKNSQLLYSTIMSGSIWQWHNNRWFSVLSLQKKEPLSKRVRDQRRKDRQRWRWNERGQHNVYVHPL